MPWMGRECGFLLSSGGAGWFVSREAGRFPIQLNERWLCGTGRVSVQIRGGMSAATRSTAASTRATAKRKRRSAPQATAFFRDGCSLAAPDELRAELRRVLPSAAFPAGVLSLVMEYRETQLMFAKSGRVVHILDVWGAQEIARIEFHVQVGCMCLLTGGTWLATAAGKCLVVWDYVRMRAVAHVELAQPTRRLCWIPKHRLLAGTDDVNLTLYDVCAAGSLRLRRRIKEQLCHMVLLPCGDRIAASEYKEVYGSWHLVILPVADGPRLFTSEAYDWLCSMHVCGSDWLVIQYDEDRATIRTLPNDGVYCSDTFLAGRGDPPMGIDNARWLRLGPESAGAVVGQASHTQLILTRTRDLLLSDLASPLESSNDTDGESDRRADRATDVRSQYTCRPVALDAAINVDSLEEPCLWRIHAHLFVVVCVKSGNCLVLGLRPDAEADAPGPASASAGAGESASCVASAARAARATSATGSARAVTARLVRSFSIPDDGRVFVSCDGFSLV